MKNKGYYIPVLSYHNISPTEWYYHNDTQFREHMQWLKDNKYTPISLETYVKFWRGQISQADLPERPVFIVFDDGRDGNYTHAYPILQEFGFQFTLFIISNKVGDFDFVTWPQIQEMLASGLCSLGTHTHDLHYFDLEGPNAETWGALAIRRWLDNGIYCWQNQGPEYELESSFALPIAGTAKNPDTGVLFPIDTYIGFYADKTMMIDRVIFKCPTHIPSETYYDVHVKVTFGAKAGATGITSPVVVNADWIPYHEPVDLVNENTGNTWVNGRFDVIHFDTPQQVVAGQWYNLRLETQNMSTIQQEMRIYTYPSLPFDTKNCATNSMGSDYNPVDSTNGYAVHHTLPMMVASDGTGVTETAQQYTDRVTADTQKVIRELEERAGSCITTHMNAPVKAVGYGQEMPTAIPLYGAGYETVAQATDDVTGEPLFEDDGVTPLYEPVNFQRAKTYFKLKFNSSFTCKKIFVKALAAYGRQYAALADIYIGLWNGGNPTSFTKVKKGFLATRRWTQFYGNLFEIRFDKGLTYEIQAGVEYCLYFDSLNQDRLMNYDKTPVEEEDIEGVFRIDGTWFDAMNQGSAETARWNVRAGDGELSADGYYHLCINPEIWFYSETSTYPVGKYVPPEWTIAFPFGAYRDETNEVLKAVGVDFQFTIYAGFFDTREFNNEATVQDLAQVPRVMMIAQGMPDFPEVVENATLTRFLPDGVTEDITVYAWVIYRDWGCNSLRENWKKIDVAIFDAFNFDMNLNISGTPNPDWTWFQQQGKKSYAMFGNFGATGWDVDVPAQVFANPTQSIDAIMNKLESEGWDGCSIDFEEVPSSQRAAATAWFKELARRLHTTGTKYYELIVAAPYPFATDPSWAEWFDYVEIAKVSDRIVPMTYLDHGSWTGPGPISDYSLFTQRYTELLDNIKVPRRALAGGLGVFGCKWMSVYDRETGQTTVTNAEQNILELLPIAQGNAKVYKDTTADEWYANIDYAGITGTFWFQAADTFHNRIRWLKSKGIDAIAIWKLDDDDFHYWNTAFGTKDHRHGSMRDTLQQGGDIVEETDEQTII